MKDYLGTKRYCSMCKHSTAEGDGIYCNNEKSKFSGLEVGSILCAPCIKKGEKTMTNENKSYLVHVSASIDIEIKANSEEEAIEKAEENWYEALQYNGGFNIDYIDEVG